MVPLSPWGYPLGPSQSYGSQPFVSPLTASFDGVSGAAGQQHRFRGVGLRNMETFMDEEAMIAIDFVRSFQSRFLFLSTNVTWQKEF